VHNKQPQYFVGIDLGTTHTVVAFAHKDNPQDIQLLPIDQLIAPGQVAAKPLLPSVRYHPAENELTESDRVFIRSSSRAIIGEAARLLGAKSKGRLVTSAKSWLSHPSVDHNAEILPWGSDEEIEKVSPVEACSSYLQHIRAVWLQRYPKAPLESQDIVLTVPASFDEGARSLTLEAAKRAGLNRVRLLEEPQAVCYDWLQRHQGTVAQALSDARLLLICDVGGGTTDLTLIKVEHTRAEPRLTRIAVGDHILLGGDNIDLALAHLIESRLQTGENRLSVADFSQLIEQCRNAKERLLADGSPDQMNITLLGGGSKLIGGSRTTCLTRKEAQQIALDGFFPLTKFNDLPDKKRSGVMEFGLPYAAEPAISKHIAAFLNQHKESSQEALGGTGHIPDAILLNGGLFLSQTITKRILELFSSWKSKPVILLENHHPELAVAYGAVSYAIARHEKKPKIGGGSARGYFLLVETASTKQTSTQKPAQSGICILPKGSEEGKEIILSQRRFALRTGVPVRFDLVSNSGDHVYKPGDITEITDEFQFLPPLVAALDDNEAVSNKDEETIVQLGVSYTDLGVLKIQCMACSASQPDINIQKRTQKRWDVEFQIRKQNPAGKQINANLPPQFDSASQKIRTVFGPKSRQIDPNAIKNLRADLEKQLGRDRSEWDTPLLRALFAVLWEGQKYRRRSEHHERIWFSLAGFCLRPGFGYPLDDWRVEQLWKLYPQGLQFTNEIQNWSEWWTLWRRIAGGLDATAQNQILGDIGSFINPASTRQPTIAKQAKQRSQEDMIRLAAVLEHLPLDIKIQVGSWFSKRLEKAGEAKQTWWALGRVAARIPFYGNSHNVIPTHKVNDWLLNTLNQDWKKNPQIAFAAALMCRKTGDRTRDTDEALRLKIIAKLKLSKTPDAWLEIVEHHKELDEKEESQFFGEALPPGLKLISTDQ
jgi:molecular chaperone DnaK (HSP70)